MNTNLYKYVIVLFVITLITAGSGCVQTPIKASMENSGHVLMVEGGNDETKQEINTDWESIVQGVPQSQGIDFYMIEGYGVTRITFQYSPSSGKGSILLKKVDDDYLNKSKTNYYVSGIMIFLKMESGEVYNPGLISFQKGITSATGISLPMENFKSFKVEELIISQD